jgi:imidazolonepropionase-like amidohydrolase
MTRLLVEKPAPAYLLQGASVIDGLADAPLEQSVLVRGERVLALGTEAEQQAPGIDGCETLDVSGLTLMPGLIDSHCHISFDEPRSNDELFFHRRAGLATLVAAANAQKVLRAGVTSFFDADCIFDVGLDLRDAIEGGVVDGPRMATGGNVLITSVGGTAGRLLPDRGRRGYAVIVQTRDDMTREIRAQIKAGVDWIKVHVSGLPTRRIHGEGEVQAFTYDELRHVCDVAHSLGVPVVGHCRNASSTRDAARAGFDMILHATFMDEEALQAVVDTKVPIVPTLTFQANLADFGESVGADANLREVFRREITEGAVALKQAFDAGVPMVCGSESGFSITPYGEWHYREMEIFVEHLGLTPMQAIQAATREGARSLKRAGELGCIAPGYLADILVVDGDPLDDLGLLGRREYIRHIFKGGVPVDLTAALAREWTLPNWRVGPFSTEVLTRERAGFEND